MLMKKSLVLLALGFSLIFSSCDKEDPGYSFTVRVVNEEGVRLPNVFIEASADVPEAIPDFKGITNENGEISFEYEYEAVLKIRATRGSNPPTWMGCNFVKLEANQNVMVTVLLIPYDPSQPGC